MAEPLEKLVAAPEPNTSAGVSLGYRGPMAGMHQKTGMPFDIAAPAGGYAGGMAGRVRDFDWAATPLGPRATWPVGLRLSVDLILAAGFPMAVRWGPDLVMIYNDACAALIGNRHPHALGQSLRETWPEIHETLGPLCQAMLRGERGSFFEEDHPWRLWRHGVPEACHFTICYSPIPDPTAASGVGGVLITSYETTTRVHNERMLRVLTETLEQQVEQRTRERDRTWQVSEDLLGVSTFEGYFTSINPAWTHLLGWTEEEIKRMHVSALRHPDDAPTAEAGRARLAQGVPTVRMENRFRHRDGSWRWLTWTMTADNGLIYVAGRHVTAEKQAAQALHESERQFRLLVAGVTDYALIMLDPSGVITSWNAGAEHIKGYTADEIIGRHFSQFYTEDDRKSGLPSRSIRIATEAGRFEAEAWRVRKDGSLFWANVVIDAIRDPDGKLLGFAKITRDITERRNAQQALERAQAQLAQAQKMEAIGEMTGGVAHDFNNLLMIVSGNAQKLARRLTDAKDVRAVDGILAATSRGEALTRQLLTFARRQPLNPRTVDPADTIRASRDILASSARGDIELRVDLPDAVWPIAIDIAEFELALVNLVVNARDALPNGGLINVAAANVTLRGDETPERLAGEFVALTVADNGVGIPDDALPKLFEPFFTTKAAGKGTGLGLSQVYGFSRQSGGDAVVESEVGVGTRVTIYLPRSHAPITAKAAESSGQMQGEGERILVVEDNPDVRAVTLDLLEQLNYRTHAVDSAQAALDRLRTDSSIDLVFTDVILPGGMDGVGLAAQIRKRHPAIPVVLTSGYAKALATPSPDLPILRKPYQIAALGEIIRSNLDARSTDRPPAPDPAPAARRVGDRCDRNDRGSSRRGSPR